MPSLGKSKSKIIIAHFGSNSFIWRTVINKCEELQTIMLATKTLFYK